MGQPCGALALTPKAERPRAHMSSKSEIIRRWWHTGSMRYSTPGSLHASCSGLSEVWIAGRRVVADPPPSRVRTRSVRASGSSGPIWCRVCDARSAYDTHKRRATDAWSASALKPFVSPFCQPSAPPPRSRRYRARGSGRSERAPWCRLPGREGWGDGAGRGGEVTLCGPNQQPADRVQAVATHLVPAAVHRRCEAHSLRALAPPGELRRVMESSGSGSSKSGDRFRWRCDRVRYRERESGVGVIPCAKRRQVGRDGGRSRSSCYARPATDRQEARMNEARWRDSCGCGPANFRSRLDRALPGGFAEARRPGWVSEP